jgi:hypothetical protein
VIIDQDHCVACIQHLSNAIDGNVELTVFKVERLGNQPNNHRSVLAGIFSDHWRCTAAGASSHPRQHEDKLNSAKWQLYFTGHPHTERFSNRNITVRSGVSCMLD